MAKKGELTNQQAATINTYFENNFKWAAAMRANGYAENTVRRLPQRLFNKPHIKKEIDRRRAAFMKKHNVGQDWLIGQFKKRALSGETLAKFKKIQKDGSLAWDFTEATQEELSLVSELAVTFEKLGRGPNAIDVKKFSVKEPDVQAALTALGRHVGFFNDKLEVTGGSLAERIAKARRQGYQPLKDGPPKEDKPTVH